MQQKKYSYELLEIISFTARKRMSVIVRNLENRQVIIYTKGADTSIFEKSIEYPYQLYF
jgi:magnesium-transporting ATPase (P-type)